MALSTLTCRVDEKDKQQFITFCDSVGLTSSAAVNMFVKTVIRERRIPFEIKTDDQCYIASPQNSFTNSDE
ncbi:type II toxin-antitoxin system RelB/DinJ family antitoxin [Anaerovibrio sp.]|uniref:type II toxin-antitoxin system RelB/DinJ family antitoxin n=1 Tax=Anaerovibrio sp. TaxID=1872532 RepID=UPI003890FBD5